MGTLVRAHYPEGSRPRALSSFEMNKLPPLRERFKLAVVIADDFQNDIMVWSAINAAVTDKATGRRRIDTAIFVRYPNDAAARWGYFHWTIVQIYGTAEEDEFVRLADRVLIVGPKEDELLAYYRDLAKYYSKPVSWAFPKEKV